MTSPLERAADAILPHLVSDKGIALTKADRVMIERAPAIVRSVLFALRGATSEMVAVGADAHESGSADNAREVWTAMIDAALSEQPK